MFLGYFLLENPNPMAYLTLPSFKIYPNQGRTLPPLPPPPLSEYFVIFISNYVTSSPNIEGQIMGYRTVITDYFHYSWVLEVEIKQKQKKNGAILNLYHNDYYHKYYLSLIYIYYLYIIYPCVQVRRRMIMVFTQKNQIYKAYGH